MEKMLVTQALNELKTLDARISRAISNAQFVASAKTSDSKIKPGQTKEDFIKDAKASYQSITDLIKRREAIKSAVVDSNAKTIVEICGESYSVAKVIDMKNSIEYQEDLLLMMIDQLEKSEATMNKNNANMESKIDQLVTAAYGKESKVNVKADEYDSIATPYRTSNECSLVDPLQIKDEITKLRNYIDEFRANVDSVLQISNCVTYVEF